MPTITIDRKYVEKLLGRKLTTEKLKDRISYLGTDLESVDDKDIVVEVFPNRPDMLSEQGFARALSSFIGAKTGLRTYVAKYKDADVMIEPAVGKVRPYTACAIVRNLSFDDEKIREIIQMQEKLHTTYCRNRTKAAIGIYPMEKIKLPIKYTAKNPKDIVFRPLESKAEMNGLQILSRHPAGREYGHLLEGKEKFPIFVDARGEILSMPPIINSHLTGKITEKTKDVFIECSGFDYDVLHRLLLMIVTTLADMGGTIEQMRLHYPNKTLMSPDLSLERMKLDLNYVNKVLGTSLKQQEAFSLLKRMGYGIENNKVLIPCYRADIQYQSDLVEDIAIAYGYENFKPELPNIFTIGGESRFESFCRTVSDILVGFGLTETNTLHISSKEVQAVRMGIDDMTVHLDNALTSEFGVLRSWMLPSLLEVLAKNKHYEYPQDIFDMGIVFSKKGDAINERTRLAVALCSHDVDFTKIKQHLDALMRALDVKYEMMDTEHPSFIPGRVGRVNVEGKGVAYIGELHPKTLTSFALEMPVVAFELNLTDLFEVMNS